MFCARAQWQMIVLLRFSLASAAKTDLHCTSRELTSYCHWGPASDIENETCQCGLFIPLIIFSYEGHVSCWWSVRFGSHVSASSHQVGSRDEESCRILDSVHGKRKTRIAETRWNSRLGRTCYVYDHLFNSSTEWRTEHMYSYMLTSLL